MTKAQIRALDQTVAKPQEMGSTLDALVPACNGDHRAAWPIIESLEGPLHHHGHNHNAG